MNASESLVDQFTFVILLATLAALLPYLLCALARLVIARKNQQPLPPLEVFICIVAIAFASWAIVGTGAETIYWGGFLLLIGLPVYALVKWQFRRAQA